MPRREDERLTSISGKHPVYCTCIHCTEKFLQKKGIKPGRSLKEKLFSRARGEKVRTHPDDCQCATCNLLRSVNSGAAGSRSNGPGDGRVASGADGGADQRRAGYHRKSGILRRILGKK